MVLLGVVLPEASGQRRLPPRSIPYSELEREEGIARLEEMRQMGIEGVYSFLFELRVMPRRGEEKRFQGQMWGSRNALGPVYRYEIWSREESDSRVLRFLVQNGSAPGIWMYDTAAPEAGVRELPREELFSPIEGMDFTPFDLQMPFVYWEDFAYEGLSRVRGRSSHGFLMNPPSGLAGEFPWLAGVRMFLDAEFNALTGAEVVGEEGKVLRSFNIIEIKRVEEQWLVKTIDFRNEETGNKTRLSIGAAALNLAEDRFAFTPETLARAFPSVSRDEFTFF